MRTAAADRFIALLRPIERELEIYCRRMNWNANDVPDTLQNAVLRAWQAFDRYHADASFRAWMFTILTREIFAMNRKYARLSKLEFQLEPEEMRALPALGPAAEPTDWLASPDVLSEVLSEVLDQDLLAALRMLTENERAVLLLRAIGDFHYAEIAETLAIPMGSVMGHLARARKKMREALRRSDQRATP